MSKKKNKMSKFGRTEIDESLKSMGDIAKLTLLRLRAAFYVRGGYGDIKGTLSSNDTNMGGRMGNIEYFIHHKTNWYLVAMYSDIAGASYYNYEPEYFLTSNSKDRFGLNALLESIENKTLNIDVLVVDSISQLSRDIDSLREVCNKLINNQIIIFCLDTRDMIAMNDLVNQKLSEGSFDKGKFENEHI